MTTTENSDQRHSNGRVCDALLVALTVSSGAVDALSWLG